MKVTYTLTENAEAVRTALDQIAPALGLTLALRTTHATRPGSDHRHYSRPPAAGTLEVTILPDTRTTTIEYRNNRIGSGWVPEAARALATIMAASLGCTVDRL